METSPDDLKNFKQENVEHLWNFLSISDRENLVF